MRFQPADLAVGTRVGRLTVLGPSVSSDAHRRVAVRCACGHELTVRTTQVVTGLTRSCGRCAGKSARMGEIALTGPPAAPRASWWLACQTREQFAAQAAQEARRMTALPGRRGPD
jgi:hypothetical protein